MFVRLLVVAWTPARDEKLPEDSEDFPTGMSQSIIDFGTELDG